MNSISISPDAKSSSESADGLTAPLVNTNTLASDVRCSNLTRRSGAGYEIIDNLHERRKEAQERGWLGEIEGLDISLLAAQQKLARMQTIVGLGMPRLPSPDSEEQGG